MRVNKYIAGLLTLLILTSISCGMIDTVVNQAVDKAAGGSENFQSVSSLWSDVPQMDGFGPSGLEKVPPFVKLALQLVIGNLGRLNGQGQDQTTGNIDWIAFTTAKTPQDVQSFYTNDLMASNGWDSNDSSPCISGNDQTSAQGSGVCVFSKTQDGKNVQLVIITGLDEGTKQTNVFFLRLEESGTPVPTSAP